MNRARATLLLLFFGTLLPFGQAAAPQEELILDTGVARGRIESRDRAGRLLYRIRDMAQLLGLELDERGGRLIVTGSRGALVLEQNRSLVRMDGPDVLLSEAVWRRRRGDWYVPEDFLTRALPLLLDKSFKKSDSNLYEVETLLQNRVAVRLENYPPQRVRIVFEPERPVPIRVSEFPDHLLVEFEEYKVVPILPAQRPDANIVGALEFVDQHPFGSFRIEKGLRYEKHDRFHLRSPEREVVDVFGALPAQAPARTAPVLPSLPAPNRVENDEFDIPRRSEAEWDYIVLDPGHGGVDAGAISSGDQGEPDPVLPQSWLEEKTLALDLAQRIQERHLRHPYRFSLTRNRDINLPLDQRSAIANSFRAKAFVSLHLAASKSPLVAGPVVYVCSGGRSSRLPSTTSSSLAEEGSSGTASADSLPAELTPWQEGQVAFLPQSRRLGQILQQRLNALFETNNRLVEAPLAVLAPVTAPAVFVELGYLSNEADAQRLGSPTFRDALAQAIASALDEFLQ